MKFLQKIGFLAVALIAAGQLRAEVKEVAVSPIDKYKEAINSQFAVVQFSKMNDTIPADQEVRQDVRDMNDRFKVVSNNYRYRDAEVMFVNVNVLQPEALGALAKEYKIEKYPTFMLFKNGQPVKENDQLVKRVAFLSEQELKSFIESYLGDDISAVVTKLERARAEGRREARYDRPRTSFYVGYGYPYYDGYYWGGYPYYRRGYWGGGWGGGVGFGWGGGWGGRRWHRW